ncbi:MAG TPA: histidinol-phosphate transaminase [Firmicutes bacterium]|nr:histidinol-phosphate transaminase [Bacillales bacterium]HJA41035.1 histidinol-phosphate transaminase [Bacillota bacterium]
MKVKPQFAKLSAYVPGRSIETIQKTYQLDTIHKLASNENPFGCSKKVEKAIRKYFHTPNIYPDGAAMNLRIALSAHLNVQEEQILFGAGVDEIIQMISRALLLPGDNIVQADLTFSQYAHHAVIEGADVKRVPLIAGVHDLPGMLQAIDERTKIVWICNPNNPTGTIVDQTNLFNFVKQVPPDVLIVLDEAYYEYVTTDCFAETIPWIQEFENIVVTRTFSKAYGLAAYRIGYAVARKEFITQLNLARLPFNTSTIAQVAAFGALKGQKFIQKCVKENEKGRQMLESYCRTMGIKSYPSQANFVYMKLSNAEQLSIRLEQKGFIVRAFPNGIRVTIPKQKVLEQFIKVFSKVYKKRK